MSGRLCMLLGLLLGLGPWQAELLAEPDGPTLVLVAGQVFTATGELHSPGVIVIRAGRIQAVGSPDQVIIPDGAEVQDLGAVTVLPGLIDTHIHLGGTGGSGRLPDEYRIDVLARNLRADLYWGVTTSLSLADHTATLLALRDAVAAGQLAGPRLLLAGKAFTAPGGHPAGTVYADMAPALVADMVWQGSDAASARLGVGRLAARGVDVIKVVLEPGLFGSSLPCLDDRVLEAIVAEATARGLPVIAHVSRLADAQRAVALGVRALTHVPVGEGDLDALIAAMLAHDVAIIPTLAVFEGYGRVGDPWAFPHYDRPAIRAGIAREVWESARLATDPASREPWRELFGEQRAVLGAMMAAGVRLVHGSDAGNPGTFHGLATLRELELLVGLGLPPEQALLAATREAARWLGQDGEIGTVAAGCRADLLVVAGDPLTTVADIYRVQAVMQGGRWVDRAALSFADEHAAPWRLRIGVELPSGIVVPPADSARWQLVTDAMSGGVSTIALSSEPDRSRFVLRGVIADEGPIPFAVARLVLGDWPWQRVDATGYTGIRLRYRSDRPVRFTVGIQSTHDYDEHGLDGQGAEAWRQLLIPFQTIRQAGWGLPVRFRSDELRSLGVILVGAPGPYEVWIEAPELVRE